MIELAKAIVRLLLACCAIIATVVFSFALVAAALYLLVWLGVP